MKKVVLWIMVAAFLSACGQPKELLTQDGQKKTYPTYGLLNEGSSKSDKVCYETSIGNVLLSIVLIEFLVFPIYFVGFSLYNPVEAKINGKCGPDK